jgi:hypothetical protein
LGTHARLIEPKLVDGISKPLCPAFASLVVGGNGGVGVRGALVLVPVEEREGAVFVAGAGAAHLGHEFADFWIAHIADFGSNCLDFCPE